MRSFLTTLVLACSLFLSQVWGEGPDLTLLEGEVIDLQLTNGKFVPGVTVSKITPGTDPGSVKTMVVKYGQPEKSQSVAASLIAEIFHGGQSLDIECDKKKKTISHKPERREARLKQRAEMEERLQLRRARLWPDLSAKEQEEWVTKHKAFMQDVGTKMPGVTLQLVETKYYLFYTDMPPASVAVFIAYLDSMYEQLSKAFGIPAGKNIFCGKCVVVAFNTQESFLQFEKVVYNNVPNEGTAGLCHSSSSGEVVISVHKLSNPFSFANVLVHETSHGVVHRWLSSVRVPSWINEGIADWVAAAVVKGSRDVTNKQSLALERVRQTASLGGRYFDETMNIEFMYYGIASNMVEFLLRVDANKYRQFLTNIKEGYTTEESLQKSYGVTMQQFVQQYGAAIGVPQLQP